MILNSMVSSIFRSPSFNRAMGMCALVLAIPLSDGVPELDQPLLHFASSSQKASLTAGREHIAQQAPTSHLASGELAASDFEANSNVYTTSYVLNLGDASLISTEMTLPQPLSQGSEAQYKAQNSAQVNAYSQQLSDFFGRSHALVKAVNYSRPDFRSTSDSRTPSSSNNTTFVELASNNNGFFSNPRSFFSGNFGQTDILADTDGRLIDYIDEEDLIDFTDPDHKGDTTDKNDAPEKQIFDEDTQQKLADNTKPEDQQKMDLPIEEYPQEEITDSDQPQLTNEDEQFDSDDFFRELTSDPIDLNGDMDTHPDGTQVSEPTPALLIVLGLIGIIVRRRFST